MLKHVCKIHSQALIFCGETHRNCVPVSSDIVSPHKTIRGDELIYPPDGINRYRVSPIKLKLDIKHKMLLLNIRSVNV